MEAAKDIQNIINSIKPDSKNKTGDIFLNVINNEFIKLQGEIEIPKIPVKELDYDTSVEIVKELADYIPQFLADHLLLEKRKPPSEQHFLQFLRILTGRHIYFIHMFKIDLKFSGDSSNIIEQGNSDFFPSYKTDRIYYKSQLIPEISVLSHNDSIIDFTTIRLKSKKEIVSDQHLHTFAIFDEMNTGEISIELCKHLDEDIFNISPGLYPLISYDYFSAAFNIFYPTPAEIGTVLDIFEPLFIYIYSKYMDYRNIISNEKIEEKFNNELSCSDDGISLRGDFSAKLKEYFHRYSLVRNEELRLKGWKKIEKS